MGRLTLVLAILMLGNCGKVLVVKQTPEIAVGQSSFFRTIEAHTDAPVTGGNRIDVLLNGDETFPVMLAEIRKAKATITFAQYLYQDGSIADDLATAFAARCRAGVKAEILLDHHGSGSAPADIINTMKEAGCNVQYFRQIDAQGIIFPWKLIDSRKSMFG